MTQTRDGGRRVCDDNLRSILANFVRQSAMKYSTAMIGWNRICRTVNYHDHDFLHARAVLRSNGNAQEMMRACMAVIHRILFRPEYSPEIKSVKISKDFLVEKLCHFKIIVLLQKYISTSKIQCHFTKLGQFAGPGRQE